MADDTARIPTFDQIIGQDRALAALASALDSGRLHHAWIFAGPAGVGKHTTALAFAAALLDETTRVENDRIGTDPDSPARRLLDAATHPDLHLINKELARYSDDRAVRERKLMSIPKQVVEEHLLEPIARSPSVTSDAPAGKVFVIDEAELLDRSTSNAPVQNSILKTLEEPPPRTVMILVTASEDRLLPTIRSRCQRVAFASLDERAMDAWFERHAPGLDADTRRRAALLAQGSPGRARLALDTGLVEWADAVTPLLDALDRRAPDAGAGESLAKLVDAWAAAWVKEHAGASKEAANAAATGHMIALLGEMIRARLRDAAASGDHRAVESALARIDALHHAEHHARANVNLNLVFEGLVSGLARA